MRDHLDLVRQDIDNALDQLVLIRHRLRARQATALKRAEDHLYQSLDNIERLYSGMPPAPRPMAAQRPKD